MDIFKTHVVIIFSASWGSRHSPDRKGDGQKNWPWYWRYETIYYIYITIVIIYKKMTIKLLTVILEIYLVVTPSKSQNKPSDYNYIPQI